MNFSKPQAILFSAVFLGIVISPIAQNCARKPKDSFPLSYYPMFAKKRSENYGLYYVVGHDTLGNKNRIPYRLVGTGGFNQVRRQINRGPKKERGIPFLKKVSQTLAHKDVKLYKKLVHLELVKGYYHLENYFLHKDTIPVLERTISKYKLKDHEELLDLP
ncbi:hypothetical protein [Poritiphilus flavus]|uniref:Uncharacterized protein n=1 Tax=Poritiphilus flavus TaxID=2697053 RepID=A0A6L9EBR3_9FLAO|nr:hypothetical protein [Poritiphilus flavus]NAS11859.1 hypothetical protein [Poritiphilus flavus]